MIARVTAVPELLYPGAIIAKWLFPQEKATSHDPRIWVHELWNRSRAVWPAAAGALIFSCVVWGQTKAKPAKPAPPQAPKTCPAFDPKHLELDQSLQAGAQNMATRMVLNYRQLRAHEAPDAVARNVTNVTGGLEQFNLQMFTGDLAAEDCIGSSNAAIAKAVTGQTNTQTGASPVASGTTSAAQEVGIPQVLAIAVENGAIADSVSGTTMTLSTTPYGFVFAFDKNADTQERYQDFDFFSQLGLSSTFNIASTADPLQSAGRKAISQWQAKYTFRDTSPRASTVHRFYESLVAPSTAGLIRDLSSSVNDQAETLQTYEAAFLTSHWSLLSAGVKAAEAEYSEHETTAGAAVQALANQILQLFDTDPTFQSDLAAAVKNQPLSALALQFGKDMAAYQAQYQQLATAVANLPKGWNGDLSLSQEFPSPTTTTSSTTTVSPPAYLAGEFDLTCDPKTDTAAAGKASAPVANRATAPAAPAPGADKAILSCPLGPKVTLTGNFAGSFYPDPKPALHETAYRGMQAALMVQLNDLGGGPFRALKSANDKSKMTLSFSGNYQRLEEDKDLTGKRPDIVAGNIKLSIPISGGASFPVAISFGNATSQVKGNYVAGNFGISFDLDALATLTKLK